MIEEIDPSYEIDASMWKKIKSFDEVDLKPAVAGKPGAVDDDGEEKADISEKASRKKAEEVEEEADSGEDSGFSEIVIRTEKERDQEFREFVRELCRPQIVSFLPDRNAPRGSDIRITCTVQGNNVQARWLKDEVALERGKRIQTKSDGEVHSLEITGLTDKDAGEYTLVLKNRAGEVETSSRVRVFDGKLHKPDHIDIALVKDYYDHNLGGLVIEAHVHGLPLPTVKFYKDNHLIKPKKDKVDIFVENKEIYQCLMIRPDPSVSGTYTILAENKAGKKRFTHIVDFVTKYPFYNAFPGMRHADKDLDDFVEEILEHLPKDPNKKPEVETEKGAKDNNETEKTIEEPQKPEEVLVAVAEALKSEEVVEAPAVEVTEEEKPKKKHHRSHHKKKHAAIPSVDDGLIDDEDEVEEPTEVIETIVEPVVERRRQVQEEVHEPYEFESFRIFNNSKSLKFSGGLSNQTVIEGKNIKMICAVSGPLPILKWFKNGKPVPWSATIQNNSGEGLGQVIIQNIQRSDAAVYTCCAKNQFSEITTEAVIKVIPKSVLPISTSKPQFTRVLGEFYHILEDDLVLNAHCRGVPDPKIKWSKDGIEISEKTDPRFMFSYDHDGGYKFCIHKPSIVDNAIYGCHAENSTGNAKITHKVIFHEHVRHTHPQFVYHKESFIKPAGISIEPSSVKTDVEVTEVAGQSGGDQVQVPVTDSGAGNQGSGQTNGDSSNGTGADGGTGGGAGDGNDDGDDKRNNEKFTEDNEVAEKAEDEEEEESVQKKEIPYRSTRRRRFDGPSESYVIRDSVKKIQYDVKLKDHTVLAGSNIKLYCQISGPQPVTKWFKNDKNIDWSPTLRNVSKEGTGAIIISNATERDSGVYKCVAKNAFNEIETECNVIVFKIEEIEVKPTFTRIADYYKMEVDDLIIEVHVRGVPNPKIRWSRDGIELDVENSDKFLVMREADGCYKLCIHDPQKMDSGRFIIEASNKAGKEEIRHQIRFLGKEHYKYLAGIRHADPKRQIEDDGVKYVEPEPEVIVADDDGFEEMDKWGGMKQKKEKKIRLRQKIWMPPSEESIKESAMLHEVRNRLTFESELKNAVASVGNKIKLLCTVVGPSPSLNWFKDDEPFEFTPPRVKNTSSGSFGSITFLAVNESDNGIYKCVAGNQVSEAESSCQLTVLPTQDPNWIKPTFTRLLKEYYDQKVNDLILEVHVRGYPRPTLYWVKDGLEIFEGDDKYFATRHPDGVYRLNIHDPLIKDSGRYGCIAKNDAGSEDFKYYLKVKPKEAYIHTALLHHADPTQFAKYKEEEERKRQERLAFRPPPRVVEKPAEPIPEPEPEVEEVEEESEYETTDSEYDEEGERIEKVKRKKIKKEPTPPPKEPTPPPKEPTPPPKEATPPVEVAPKKKRNWLEGAPEGIPEPVKEAPKPKSKFHLEFCTKLENRTSVEGAPVKLFCQIQGPRPEVEWQFNGEPIEYDGSSKNISSDGVAAIVFYKAKPSQSGEYTCIVKNRECKIDAKCTLTILEMPKPMEKGLPPQFPFGIKHSYNSQIDDLIIETVIRGTPRLFVKWYKDCREIENDDKYLMAKTGETYKLFIHKPTFRDSGTYMLGVENQYGIEHLKYDIDFENKELAAVSGFIYHADLTKTKKFQNEEQRKKDERMAYRPPPLPKPEVAEEVPVQVEVVEEVEEESEYETTDSEYDEEGELIEKERRKKIKKEPTPPPKEPTPPPKEPTPPPKEPTPPPKEPTPPPTVELKEGETEAVPLAEGETAAVVLAKGETAAVPLAEGEASAVISSPKVILPEIEKPLVIFRTHHIREFRKNADVPLEILKRLLSTVVKVGSHLKLSCLISESDPRIKVTWFKDEVPLELETRIKATCSEDGLAMLEFKNVMLEDAGRYKCLIKVKKGEIFSECDVGVYGEEESPATDVPPTLVTTITDLYRPQYNDIVIEIRLRGDPKPTIQWIRDGLAIDQWKQYQKYQMLNEETNNIMSCKLIITSPNQFRDNGKYFMIAKNRVKSVEFVHTIDWEPKKHEPKRKRMDEIFVVNEVPRVNPKPKSPTPPPVEEKPVEEVVEEVVEEEPEEEEAQEEEEEED